MVRAGRDQDSKRFPFKMPLAVHGWKLMKVLVEDSEAVTRWRGRGASWDDGAHPGKG